MGKLGWTVIIVMGCSIAADQYLNYRYYSDGVLSALRQIRHSFGW
jgi:hypothetical protein